MDLKIVSKEKNPFLKREKLKFEINNTTKTPSRKEIRQKIASLTNAKEDVLVVEDISHKFGHHSVFGEARIYDSKEEMEKTEQKHIIARNFPKPKEKKEEPPKAPKEAEKEQKKEGTKEKPAEQKKERVKEEKPKEEAKEQKPAEEKKE